MLTTIDNAKAFAAMNGGPVVFVTSRSADGVDNVMACAWSCPFEMRPDGKIVLILELPHTTSKNIIDTGVFGISVPGTALRKPLLASGCVHGRKVGDKFEHLKIEKLDAVKLPVPLVAGALAQLECSVVDMELFKKHGILMGKIEAARADDTYWTDDGFNFNGHNESTMHSAGATTYFTRGKVAGWGDE